VDVCIVHNAFTLHFNLPLTAALHQMVEAGEGPRFVAWCHDLSWKNELYLPKMRDAYPWELLRRPLDRVAYVVVSASRQAELADLFGWTPGRFRVIPAGVDVDAQLKLEPETVELVSRLGLLEANPLMLAPERITKRKNLELAIRITHALRLRDMPARLLVTGPPGPHNVRSGDYVDELRKLRSELGVEREVVLLFEHTGTPGGEYPVSDRMMYDLYSLSDLLLFTSEQEGFGIPLLEAALFKLPVFCSNIPPFREIGGDAVRYFELGDNPEVLADRLVDWTRGDCVHRLRRKVMDGYRWESIFGNQIEPLVAGR
jgi:glycosyltransferase involved in cell wall biosynthesis